jgi:protein required for attachment to host cells
MAAMWIVSANAGRARFFESKPWAPLEEIEDMVNDAVRVRASQMEPDRLGPTAATSNIHDTGGALPNKTYEPHPSPHKHKTEVFAKSICKQLLQAHQQGRFQQLTLVASPEFLGALRSCLDPHLKLLVTREINKDYTHVGPDQLREQIAQHQKS